METSIEIISFRTFKKRIQYDFLRGSSFIIKEYPNIIFTAVGYYYEGCNELRVDTVTGKNLDSWNAGLTFRSNPERFSQKMKTFKKQSLV